jgi:hypothetical protein
VLRSFVRSLTERLGLAGDRRRATRTPTDRPCNIGAVVDVSSTGARIRCRRFFRPTPGKRVTLAIPTGVQGPGITASGVICWVSNATGEWHAGIALDQRNVLIPSGARRETRRRHLRERQDALFRADWDPANDGRAA